MNLIKSATKYIQSNCEIYICECRPKSPSPFQDAFSICEYLSETNYDFTIIPDMAIANLMANNKISYVIMGAVTVYIENGMPKSFVNTCGSLMVLNSASKYNIPVYVIAESSKFVDLKNSSNDENVHYEQEEEIFFSSQSTLDTLKAKMKVHSSNIGFDLCPFSEKVYLVSDKNDYSFN